VRRNVPSCISASSHPINALETSSNGSLPYHAAKMGSPSEGCIRCWIPQMSDPVGKGGNCLPTTRLQGEDDPEPGEPGVTEARKSSCCASSHSHVLPFSRAAFLGHGVGCFAEGGEHVCRNETVDDDEAVLVVLRSQYQRSTETVELNANSAYPSWACKRAVPTWSTIAPSSV
jgi:hypothetical protein